LRLGITTGTKNQGGKKMTLWGNVMLDFLNYAMGVFGIAVYWFSHKWYFLTAGFVAYAWGFIFI
jgi:hypothetical protein